MKYFEWLPALLPKLLISLAVFIGIVLIVLTARWLYRQMYLLHRPVKILELTPPARGNLAPEATSQLLLSLSSMLGARRLYERLLGLYEPVSLEIVSTRSGGIRYLIYCHERHAKTIEHMVASYLADVKVKYIEDYLKPANGQQRVYEFRQKAHFAYPLKSFEFLDNHDPISYITNSMTKLADGELMSYQLVLQPFKSREVDSMVKQILSNTDLKPKLEKHLVSLSLFGWFGRVTSNMLFGILDVFSMASHP